VLPAPTKGELEVPLPVGLVYAPNGAVALDPDAQIRDALQFLFDTYRQTGAASAVVRRFEREVEQTRALLDAIPTPIWLRDASGKLAFEHPDDFAGALVLDGPIACGVEDRFSDVVSALGSPVRRTDPGSFTSRWYPSPDNATLGIGATGDYWLSGLSARDKAYGKLATVVADDAALPDPITTCPMRLDVPAPSSAPVRGSLACRSSPLHGLAPAQAGRYICGALAIVH